MNSLNADNYQNISAVIVFEGDTVATIPAGDLFPTLFNDFYYGLEGGDYTVYFTNEGTELDGIAAQVIASDGTTQDLLCSGGCTTDPQVCFDITINADTSRERRAWTMTNSQRLCRGQRCSELRQQRRTRRPSACRLVPTRST